MNARSPSTTLPIQFNGKAGEYFDIWIVNVCLTLITLGLYSPWAKIRKKRYFYGSTTLAGASFDYVANPIAILKGRLIAVVAIVGLSIITQFAPWVNALWSIIFLGLMPWLIVRTLRFNAINTVYRNLHFGFKPAYRSCYKSYVYWPMLIPLTLGLILPWVKFKQKKFIVENFTYGNSAFHFGAQVGDFLTIYRFAPHSG